jgi:hypothetical protein
MPNPVQPDFDAPSRKTPNAALQAFAPLLDTYGLSPPFLNRLSDRPAMFRYPQPIGPLDVLQPAVLNSFKRHKVLPGGTNNLDTLIITNHRLSSAMNSATLRETLPLRTTIKTVGPSLKLPPSLWPARSVWVSGGLVTFSPTFILKSPEKFGEIMEMIRGSHNWAAYVIPIVIEWTQSSWNEPA